MVKTAKNKKNNLDKKYNGVTVEKSWSFTAFCREHGNPKFATCVDSEGEEFNSLAYMDEKDEIDFFVNFGYSVEGITPAEIARDKDKLKVGLNSSGNYTLFRQDGGWQELDII